MTTDRQAEPPIAELARRHGVSEGAVRTVLDALRSGGGRMAQFSHPDFGGMSQWSSGMTMVGDMFNGRMKATLDALATDLADWLGDHPAPSRGDGAEREVSYRSSAGSGAWWPDKLGTPSSTGSQNHVRYAIFPDTRRLVIEDGGKRSVYDTGDHRIGGISQAQGGDSTIRFTSQSGFVRLSELKRVAD